MNDEKQKKQKTKQNKMAVSYKTNNVHLGACHIKEIMNVFIRSMARTFSFGEGWSVSIQSASPR